MVNRRSTLMLLSGTLLAPQTAFAATPREITWDDLIPPGVPYSEIIGQGEIDENQDLWNPIYDDNATRLNEELNETFIKMPGYIVPFDIGARGVKDFMLVPYVGACIHTPPPPANQLVLVQSSKPWPGDKLWDPVWVTGLMRTQLQSTNLGKTGYFLTAEEMEVYVW